MRYTVVLLLLLSGTAASNAGTLMERLRLAQNQTFAECVSNCNSNNFSCAQNRGLSGACVAQCTAASAACKNGCNRLKKLLYFLDYSFRPMAARTSSLS
jgi:hypothetical protein